MSDNNTFVGFPKESVGFLLALARNNQRLWFQRHRDEYADNLLAPAADFVAVMGERLRRISPHVVAIPKIDQSIFRIHRDCRFSKDKSPYKTHLGIWMWEGDGGKNGNSGFYFHLEPPNLMLGVGMYIFHKPMLQEYRDSVVHSRYGPALTRALAAVRRSGPYTIGGKRYVRTPRGYDPQHKRAELLLYGGLWAGLETPIPKELYTPKIVDYCYNHFKNMLPLHKWQLAMKKRVE
ncbi:MAG: DUF2461 domain-containing protein [bacterium]